MYLFKVNGYPTWVVRQTARMVVMELSQIQSTQAIDTNEETEQTNMLILSNKGRQGDRP